MTMIPKDLFSGWVPSPTCTCWLKPASYPFFRLIRAVSKPCEPHKQWVFWNRFVFFLHMLYRRKITNGDFVTPQQNIGPWRFDRRSGTIFTSAARRSLEPAGTVGTVVWLRWVQPGDEMRIEWELNYHNLAANLMGYICTVFLTNLWNWWVYNAVWLP